MNASALRNAMRTEMIDLEAKIEDAIMETTDCSLAGELAEALKILDVAIANMAKGPGSLVHAGQAIVFCRQELRAIANA